MQTLSPLFGASARVTDALKARDKQFAKALEAGIERNKAAFDNLPADIDEVVFDNINRNVSTNWNPLSFFNFFTDSYKLKQFPGFTIKRNDGFSTNETFSTFRLVKAWTPANWVINEVIKSAVSFAQKQSKADKA